jgi:V/A-type H+-transporting ATPase subunit F
MKAVAYPMARVVVLTDPETAMGFRLAGIETLEAREMDEAQRLLAGLFEQREPGVVMFNEDYLQALPDRLQKRLEDSLQPIFVPIPHIQSWQEGERKEEYLSRLLRRAIGYQIKIRR